VDRLFSDRFFSELDWVLSPRQVPVAEQPIG
jgi:hypothetical protein